MNLSDENHKNVQEEPSDNLSPSSIADGVPETPINNKNNSSKNILLILLLFFAISVPLISFYVQSRRPITELRQQAATCNSLYPCTGNLLCINGNCVAPTATPQPPQTCTGGGGNAVSCPAGTYTVKNCSCPNDSGSGYPSCVCNQNCSSQVMNGPFTVSVNTPACGTVQVDVEGYGGQCAGAGHACSTNQPTATSRPLPSSTPRPTNTPIPTSTPMPTATLRPSPTNTPRPTNTPIPTNTSVPTNTPLPTSTPTPVPAQCNDYCNDSSTCGGLSCINHSCRLAACSSQLNCTCPSPTPTPWITNTPIPGSCNFYRCSTNSDCANNLICTTEGYCRNPDCPLQANCACYFVPTPSVPVTGNGTTILGLGVISGGIILLLLGLML